MQNDKDFFKYLLQRVWLVHFGGSEIDEKSKS